MCICLETCGQLGAVVGLNMRASEKEMGNTRRQAHEWQRDCGEGLKDEIWHSATKDSLNEPMNSLINQWINECNDAGLHESIERPPTSSAFEPEGQIAWGVNGAGLIGRFKRTPSGMLGIELAPVALPGLDLQDVRTSCRRTASSPSKARAGTWRS